MNQRGLPLKFERIRSFGAVFSDTRKLIRENFAVFFRTILFLVGPFALITCTVQVFYEVNILSVSTIESEWTSIGTYVGQSFLLSQLRWLINGVITALVVSHFIKVYKELGPGKFDVNDVTRSIFRSLGGSLLTAVLICLLVALLSVVIGVLIYGVTELSVGLGVFLLVVGYVVYFLIRFPLWYFLYSVFVARYAGGPRNPFEALVYAWQIMKGSFWKTWGIFFVMWLLLYVVGTTLSLPAQIIAMGAQLSSFDPTETQDMDWKLIQSILTSLGEFARTIVYSVFCTSIALHFYSMKEQKDGEGMKELLDKIGKSQPDDGIELTY